MCPTILPLNFATAALDFIPCSMELLKDEEDKERRKKREPREFFLKKNYLPVWHNVVCHVGLRCSRGAFGI